MPKTVSPPWRRDSHFNASGKPSAVQKLSIGQAWPGSPGRTPSGRYSGPRRRCAAARRLEAPLNSARAFLYAASAMLPIRPMATAL